MRAPRCFVHLTLQCGADVPLPEAAFRHLIQVLRLTPGSAIRLFNGSGGEYSARLLSVERRQAVARIEAHTACERESPLAVHLLQAVCKGERMDYAMQKAVELGAASIVPVWTERGVVKPQSAARLIKRVQHWRGIIVSACEQCGRNRLPTLGEPLPLHQALNAQQTAIKLLLDPTADTGLRQLQAEFDTIAASGALEIALLVGPEGGWQDSEIDLASHAGWRRVALGPRVLRSETAGVTALAALQTLWGDLA